MLNFKAYKNDQALILIRLTYSYYLTKFFYFYYKMFNNKRIERFVFNETYK